MRHEWQIDLEMGFIMTGDGGHDNDVGDRKNVTSSRDCSEKSKKS